MDFADIIGLGKTHEDDIIAWKWRKKIIAKYADSHEIVVFTDELLDTKHLQYTTHLLVPDRPYNHACFISDIVVDLKIQFQSKVKCFYLSSIDNVNLVRESVGSYLASPIFLRSLVYFSIGVYSSLTWVNDKVQVLDKGAMAKILEDMTEDGYVVYQRSRNIVFNNIKSSEYHMLICELCNPNLTY